MPRKLRPLVVTIKEVTICATVEVGDVERDVQLKFLCHPGEAASRDCPGCPPYAEYQSGFFCDTGFDAEDCIDPADYKEEALEAAAEKTAGEADAAAEAKADARKDGDQ